MLNKSIIDHDGTDPDSLNRLSIAGLIRHIMSLHHRYLLEALPESEIRVNQLVEAGQAPIELLQLFLTYSQGVFQHIKQQEEWVFPLMWGIDRGQPVVQDLADLSLLLSPIQAPFEPLLQSMQKLLEQSPHGQRRSQVLQDLRDLQEDTEMHWHAEAMILFPKVLARATLHGTDDLALGASKQFQGRRETRWAKPGTALRHSG